MSNEYDDDAFNVPVGNGKLIIMYTKYILQVLQVFK
jgi:hypothetical protein